MWGRSDATIHAEGQLTDTCEWRLQHLSERINISADETYEIRIALNLREWFYCNFLRSVCSLLRYMPCMRVHLLEMWEEWKLASLFFFFFLGVWKKEKYNICHIQNCLDSVIHVRNNSLQWAYHYHKINRERVIIWLYIILLISKQMQIKYWSEVKFFFSYLIDQERMSGNTDSPWTTTIIHKYLTSESNICMTNQNQISVNSDKMYYFFAIGMTEVKCFFF